MKKTKKINELPLPEGWPKPPEGFAYVGWQDLINEETMPTSWLFRLESWPLNEKWNSLSLSWVWKRRYPGLHFAVPLSIVRTLREQHRNEAKKAKRKAAKQSADAMPAQTAPSAPEVRTAKLHWLNGGEMEKSCTGTIAEIYAEAERVANLYNTTVEVYLLTARAVVNKTVKMEEAK